MKTTFYRPQIKKTLPADGIILSGLVYSQVGVNNQTPSTTFDVRTKRDASGNVTDNTQTLGMQAPRVTRTEFKSSGKVSIGTTIPNDSSILDLTSSNAGFLMTRLTTIKMNNIISPAGGVQIYNTDKKCTFLYNGTNWRSLCARTFQQSPEGATQVSRGSAVDLTQSIALTGTRSVMVQTSFNPMTYTNGSNNYTLGTSDILIDGITVTNGMRYSTQNAGNNLYRYSAVATWTTILAPGTSPLYSG